MFFSTYVLTRKGPLAKVWLAAHWDKKLTRNEVRVVNLKDTIIHIIRPVVPIAIRTSGELLIGVVRIYALKVKHLLREATEVAIQLVISEIGGRNVTLSGDKKDSAGSRIISKSNVNAATLERRGKDVYGIAGDGEFREIADLLGDISNDGNRDDMDHNTFQTAWYAVEPVLQNDSHNTQQDFEEIARIRADLMAFGERGDSGSNSSKSKSSLSSIEKARGSHADDVPFPPVTDDLDIGAPLPDELPLEFNTHMEEREEENPFYIPELIANEVQPIIKRKAKHNNVLDMDSTTLPREAFEKQISDRDDIVDRYEARHGPISEAEEDDRCVVMGIHPHASQSIQNQKKNTYQVKVFPLSAVVSHTLFETFADEVINCVSQMPGSEGADEFDDDGHLFLDGAEGEVPPYGYGGNPVPESRKRRRDDERGNGLTNTAAATLEKIGQIIEGKFSKRRKVDACSFKEVIGEDPHRRAVARTFVDVLMLRSKDYIQLQQDEDLGELTIIMTDRVISQ